MHGVPRVPRCYVQQGFTKDRLYTGALHVLRQYASEASAYRVFRPSVEDPLLSPPKIQHFGKEKGEGQRGKDELTNH